MGMINANRRRELRSKLAKVSMSRRHKAIIECRFGLKNGIYRSLPEVGKRFKISAEGVRQVELKFYRLIGEK